MRLTSTIVVTERRTIEQTLDTAPAWHTLSVEAVLARLATHPTGLTAAAAVERLAVHGANELQTLRTQSAWHTFLAQFQNALIVILLSATIVSGFLGHTLEAVVITVIVLFAVLLGFIQEHRAGKALEALRRMAAPSAHVLRDGEESAIPARDLVPGDVVMLRAGDRVPADTRVIDAVNLAVDEAALTGESAAVNKTATAFDDPGLALGDRRNMTYAGTLVVHGRGHGVVVATGMATEFGRIARMVETVEAGRTPLQENLDRLGGTLAKAALAVVALVVVIGLAARPAGARDVHVRYRTGRCGRAGGAARRRDDLARHRRTADGQTQRPRPPPANRRDARQHVGDLLRQDRDSDEERNDGPACVRRRPRP